MRNRTALVAASALAIVAGACSTSSTPAKAEPVKVAITAKDFSLALPETFTGGLVEFTLTNEGEAPHEAQMVRLDDGKTIEDLTKAAGAMEQGKGIPDWLTFTGGINATPPGGTTTTTQQVEAGSYGFLCFIEGHFTKGMHTSATVTDGEDGDLPETTGTVTAVDYAFETDGLTGGANTVTFTNDGEQPHFAAVLGFEEGITLAQVQAEIQRYAANKQPKLPQPEEMGGLPAIEPGASVATSLNLEAGRVYLFACFLTDRAGGPPHMAKGMATPVEIA